jgi:hypothetical protein
MGSDRSAPGVIDESTEHTPDAELTTEIKPFTDMGPFEPVYITDENIEAYLAQEEAYQNNEEAKALFREWFIGVKKFIAECERCGLQTYADLGTNPNRVSFVVDDLIPTKSVGILVAEWGTGKSPLAIQLQLSVRTGVKFLGLFAITDPGQVLFVDLEGGETPTKVTAMTLARYIGAGHAFAQVFVYGANYSDVLGWGNIGHLREQVHIAKPKLVIIDPIRAFDEDTQEGNKQAIHTINALRKIIVAENCSILFIHHPNKTERDAAHSFPLDGPDPTEWMKRASGAAALVQNVDFRIGMDKKPGKENELILRSYVRLRGWSKPLTLIRDIDPKTDLPMGYRTASPLDSLSPAERIAFASLGNEFTSAEADDALGMSRKSTLDHLREWQGLYLIKMGEQGKHRKTWREPGGTPNAPRCPEDP